MIKIMLPLVFFMLISLNSFTHLGVLPPDSSVRLIDRAASVILIDEGKQLLMQGKTRDALTRFREAQIKDEFSYRAAFWVGRAHYDLANFGYALKYAKLAANLSAELDGDVHFLLGQAYHRVNELDSAKVNYELANEELSRSKRRAFRVDHRIREVDFATFVQQKEAKEKRELVPGDVNSGYDDYSPFFVKETNQLYFVSRRPDTEGGGLNPDDQRFFEDIYRSQWNLSSNEWDSTTNDLGKLNSAGFDAVGHITPDGNRMYMTRNTSVLTSKKGTRGSDICVAEFTNQGRWNNPKPIKNKTINTSYFDGAPTVTADENTMYFVSDRRGSKHMSDIYVVHKVGRKWGEAKPLPTNVNTPFNETTPYITPDGQFLFFSSEGFLGMGGYDIYVTENLGNGEWLDPINLGPEFNSVNNDTHFKYFEAINKAYLASYRIQGEKSSIDIYEMNLEGWKIPRLLAE